MPDDPEKKTEEVPPEQAPAASPPPQIPSVRVPLKLLNEITLVLTREHLPFEKTAPLIEQLTVYQARAMQIPMQSPS